MSCALVADTFFSARLSGALEEAIQWSGETLECDGMRRPDGRGLRISFTGQDSSAHLTLVIGAPELAEGLSTKAVPVNVTLIREGHAIYGTRGANKCLLDEVTQHPISQPTPPSVASTGDTSAQATIAMRFWRIEARGFCLEPVRSIADPSDAILLSTFDFRGQISWEPDLPVTTPGHAPDATPNSTP